MHRYTARKVVVAGLVLPLLLFGGSIGASAAAKHTSTGHVVYPGTINISFAVPTATQDFALYLGNDLGIFKKYGLTVDPQVVGAAALPAALESGALQLTIGTAPQNELSFQTGIPIKLIAYSAEHSVSWMTARPDITSISQLAGKPVGSSSPTAASTLMIKWVLHTAGVPVNDVTYIPVTSASAVGALVSGEVDASIFNIPEIRQAQQALPGVHTIYNFVHLTWPSGALWGYEPWLSTHKAETIAFLKAFNAALVKWDSDPTLAYQEIAKYDATTSQSTISQAYVSTIQVLNHPPQVLHAPSTSVEEFLNKVLRLSGFPTALNSYAREGQEWTPEYWNAAFGGKS